MENKLATTVVETFSTNEKVVSQHDKIAVGDMAETLVIEFDQDRFEELLSSGKSSPVSLRKHRKITIAKAMATSASSVSVKGNKVKGCMPMVNSVSEETNKTYFKSLSTSAPKDRLDSVFLKTNYTRIIDSNPVLETACIKGKASASQGEAKMIAFSKAKSLAFKAKNSGGRIFVLYRIKASKQ